MSSSLASPRTGRLLLAAVAAALALVVPLAQAAPAPPDDIPDKIAVEDDQKLFLIGHAVGVQIYTCNGTAWGPSVPRADLYDDKGKLIVTHYSGPSWEARDGSKVVAARVDGVTMDQSAIPWLLLRRVSSTAGSDGARLVKTTFIQRINTTGGLPPAASECTTAGTTAEVPYTADYLFYKSRGAAV